MPNKADNSARAFQELTRVLEQAVEAGVNSIGLEYKGGELMVFHQIGPVGLGATRIAAELKEAVIRELVRRARPSRSRTGKMRVNLLGKDYEIAVDEYEDFGQSAFNLTLMERKKKTRR